MAGEIPPPPNKDAVNSPEYLFKTLALKIKGQPELKARVDAHVLATTGHVSIEALHQAQVSPEVKLIEYRLMLQGILKNPMDFTQFKGVVAAGQAPQIAPTRQSIATNPPAFGVPPPTVVPPPAEVKVPEVMRPLPINITDKTPTDKLGAQIDKMQSEIKKDEAAAAVVKPYQDALGRLIGDMVESIVSKLVPSILVQSEAIDQIGKLTEARVREIVREELKSAMANMFK